MREKIEAIISCWIEENARKYHGITTDITPDLQGEALLKVFTSLKESGFSGEDILPHLQKISSPLAPKDSKALKKIAKHRNATDEVAKKKLSVWCLKASEKLVAAFNEVFYVGSDMVLPIEPIYKDMCRKRGIKPLDAYSLRPTNQDIQEHMGSAPIEGLTPVNKNVIHTKEENNEDEDDSASVDDILKKFKMFKQNPKNVFEEFPEVSSGPDREALRFFGIDESGDTYE